MARSDEKAFLLHLNRYCVIELVGLSEADAFATDLQQASDLNESSKFRIMVLHKELVTTKADARLRPRHRYIRNRDVIIDSPANLILFLEVKVYHVDGFGQAIYVRLKDQVFAVLRHLIVEQEILLGHFDAGIFLIYQNLVSQFEWLLAQFACQLLPIIRVNAILPLRLLFVVQPLSHTLNVDVPDGAHALAWRDERIFRSTLLFKADSAHHA